MTNFRVDYPLPLPFPTPIAGEGHERKGNLPMAADYLSRVLVSGFQACHKSAMVEIPRKVAALEVLTCGHHVTWQLWQWLL